MSGNYCSEWGGLLPIVNLMSRKWIFHLRAWKLGLEIEGQFGVALSNTPWYGVGYLCR